MKTCRVCLSLKSCDDFHVDKSSKDGLQRRCKQCVSDWNRSRRESDPEKARAELYAWRDKNRPRLREIDAKYRREHPEKQSSKRAKRRLLEREAFVEDVHEIVLAERDDGVCQLCGEDINLLLKHPDLRSFSIDHVLPLSKGGEHSYANVQSAHLQCNARKQDRIESVSSFDSLQAIGYRGNEKDEFANWRRSLGGPVTRRDEM